MTITVRRGFSHGRSWLFAALSLAAAGGCGSHAVEPEPPVHDELRPRRVVGALGRVEPARGVIDVGALPGERVERLLVSVGDAVAAGDELARLAGDGLRAAEYEAACLQRDDARTRISAQKLLAEATLAEARLGVEQAAAADLEIGAQQARIEVTRQNADVARQELDRLAGLEPRLVPAQALARKRLLASQAEAELQVQSMALERMQAAASLGRQAAAARLESAKANARVVEAGSSLAALEKAAEAARMRRELALVRVPMAGRVIDVALSEGEIVGPRPILKLADVSRMQVVAEVYESDVRAVREGQRAEVRSRAIDGVLTGTVVEIGTLVSPNEIQELGMPATTERRVVDVRIDLDDPVIAATLINLQVEVDFLEVADAVPRSAGRP